MVTDCDWPFTVSDMQVVEFTRRFERWNEGVACAVSAVAAAVALSGFSLVVGVLVRWCAHITGVWPL